MHQHAHHHRSMNRSILLSLFAAIFLLGLKVYAYFLTRSAAILSDTAESIVHVIAVLFATFSLRLSLKPPTPKHHYGYDRISFFSAGFEGALIVIAALFIFYESIQKMLRGIVIENIDVGALLIVLATAINGVLGWYLIRVGTKNNSLVLKADGIHILTDSFTSLGVIVALLLVRWTGWVYFDPLIAIIVAINILWTGYQLMKESVRGLMDHADPIVDRKLHKLLKEFSSLFEIEYHRLRHRKSGIRLFVEVHLMFPPSMEIAEAHEIVNQIEERVKKEFEEPVDLMTHLEPFEAHGGEKKRNEKEGGS